MNDAYSQSSTYKDIDNEEIQKISLAYLGYKVGEKQLSILQYLDKCLKGYSEFKISDIDIETAIIIGHWVKEKNIIIDDSNIIITKDFYDFIQQLLWLYNIKFRRNLA